MKKHWLQNDVEEEFKLALFIIEISAQIPQIASTKSPLQKWLSILKG